MSGELEYDMIAVYAVTLSGKVKQAGHKITIETFVMAPTQGEALELARSFVVKQYPNVRLDTMKGSIGYSELIIPKSKENSVL